MIRPTWVLVGLLGAFSLLGRSAAAETIEERCMRNWVNNAQYRNCIARWTKEESAPLTEQACTSKSCIYRLKCSDVQGNTVCTGAGYRVEYRDSGPGTEIFIRAPGGTVTEFSKCRTCSGMDHESGPLKDASIRTAGDDIILQVPK